MLAAYMWWVYNMTISVIIKLEEGRKGEFSLDTRKFLLPSLHQVSWRKK